MNKKIHSLALLVNLGIYGVAQAQEPTDTPVSHDDTIVVTAAEQNLQAPGVSTITADEIRKNPVARDVSEIIRTMPGVNLTGNSTSGQRGNNRQIDIRGMKSHGKQVLGSRTEAYSRNWPHVPAGFWNCCRPVTFSSFIYKGFSCVYPTISC